MLSIELASAILEGGRRAGMPVTVLYDERCPLCRRLRRWLSTQSTLVPIEFEAAGSAEARSRFPRLDHERTIRVLTAVAADGAVYEGERAWLVCTWALPAWQPLAERLGARGKRPLIKSLSYGVDWYRHRLIRRAYGERCAECSVTAPDR